MTETFKVYSGERDGMKCMRCSECGLIQEHALWYAKPNRHYCSNCRKWTIMVNLDNEEFNPSKR